MNIIQQPFLLEVWTDQWNPNENLNGYWDEVKGPMISSNEMDYLGKAYNIILTKDMFGSVKLTFSIEGLYYNPITGIKESNYLINYLFNETKIKLFYNNEWYDFIIKKIDETKDNKLTINYDCEYLPIHELSKTGHNVVFDIVNNNTVQNADGFMEEILRESDWTYVRAGTAGSDVENLTVDLSEYVEEILHELNVTTGSYDLCPITISSDGTTMQLGTPITVSPTDIIYVPQSQLGVYGKIQVIYVNGEYTYDKNGCITNPGSLYELNLFTGNLSPNLPVSTHRGKRLKNSPLTEYISYIDNENHNNDINEVCLKYEYSDTTYYSHQVNIVDDNSIIYEQNTALAPNPEKVYYLSSGGHYYPYYKLTGWLTGTTYNQYYLVKDKDNILFNAEDLEVHVYSILEYFTISRNTTTGIIETLTRIPVTNTTLISNINDGALSSIEKYRTVEIKNSNLFNLTQDIAELFEVWCKYIIVHDADGRISLDGANAPKKYVTLVSNYGIENQAGFVYGLNIDSIQRSIDSNELATKLYVDNAENQAAADGIVTIQYADENLSKENFILNFNYFTRDMRGNGALLNAADLLNDLYKIEDVNWNGEVGGVYAPGYLRHLGILNQNYEDILAQIGYGQSGLSWKLIDAKEKASTYELASKTQGASLSQNDADMRTYYTALVEELESQLNAYNEILKAIRDNKILLHKNFTKKYSRFIQEGSWQDNNYTSHNTYYYDAMKVLNEAAFPKISYTIKVSDISSVIDPNTDTDYSDYTYEVGDITYIQDTEYFGYNTNKTPYKEQIIVSEIQYHIDNPIEDEIRIQNYYTQFEDLFQRLNATVQSYDLNKNTYARAGLFNSDGTILYMSLQDSFMKNQQLTLTSNEIVKYDDKGITLTNAYDPKKITRLVSGGIVLSDDGGDTWDTGIYAGEINTRLLSAGQINTENIKVVSTGSLGAITMDGSTFKMVNTSTNNFDVVSSNITPISNVVYYLRFNYRLNTDALTIGTPYHTTVAGDYYSWVMPTFVTGDILYISSNSKKLILTDSTNLIKQFITYSNTQTGTSISFSTITRIYISVDTSQGWLADTISSNYYTVSETPGCSIEISPIVGIKITKGSTTQFQATAAGDITLVGTINATSGNIGQDAANKWVIGTNTTNASIYNSKTSYADTEQGIYLGTDGIYLGDADNYFKVGKDGIIYAKGAQISGNITATSLTLSGVTWSQLTEFSSTVEQITADTISVTYLNADMINAGSITGIDINSWEAYNESYGYNGYSVHLSTGSVTFGYKVGGMSETVYGALRSDNTQYNKLLLETGYGTVLKLKSLSDMSLEATGHVYIGNVYIMPGNVNSTGGWCFAEDGIYYGGVRKVNAAVNA